MCWSGVHLFNGKCFYSALCKWGSGWQWRCHNVLVQNVFCCDCAASDFYPADENTVTRLIHYFCRGPEEDFSRILFLFAALKSCLQHSELYTHSILCVLLNSSGKKTQRGSKTLPSRYRKSSFISHSFIDFELSKYKTAKQWVQSLKAFQLTNQWLQRFSGWYTTAW